jgi:hypothetical protein
LEKTNTAENQPHFKCRWCNRTWSHIHISDRLGDDVNPPDPEGMTEEEIAGLEFSEEEIREMVHENEWVETEDLEADEDF